MRKNEGLTKKKRSVWVKILNLTLFLIFILFFPLAVCSYGKEPIRMEYSLKQLAGLYSESLIFGVKEDLIELNQIVHWGGTYKPHLKKEGNIIKIIFMQEAVNSVLQTFNFRAKIINLERGKYNEL